MIDWIQIIKFCLLVAAFGILDWLHPFLVGIDMNLFQRLATFLYGRLGNQLNWAFVWMGEKRSDFLGFAMNFWSIRLPRLLEFIWIPLLKLLGTWLAAESSFLCVERVFDTDSTTLLADGHSLFTDRYHIKVGNLLESNGSFQFESWTVNRFNLPAHEEK